MANTPWENLGKIVLETAVEIKGQINGKSKLILITIFNSMILLPRVNKVHTFVFHLWYVSNFLNYLNLTLPKAAEISFMWKSSLSSTIGSLANAFISGVEPIEKRAVVLMLRKYFVIFHKKNSISIQYCDHFIHNLTVFEHIPWFGMLLGAIHKGRPAKTRIYNRITLE